MGEKNILAYFRSPDEAEAMASRLKSLRVADMSIDRFSRYPGEGVEGPVSPVTGNVVSLAGLTMDTSISTRDTGVLMSADPSASGMSHGGQGGPTGRNILLTVVIDESQYEQAMRLIEEAGGRL